MRYQEAAHAFADAIDPAKDFAFAPAHAGLGDAYRFLRNKTGDDGWAIRARQAYQRAVPLDRDFGFAGAEKRWGELEAGMRQSDAAIAHMNEALRLWPYDHMLVKAVAGAWESAGQPEQAEKVLREAAGRTPQCWLAHNALADYYSRHARMRDAEKVLLEVVRLAPDNANAFHNLALNYRRLGRLDDAIEMAARSIALRPLPLSYSTLGRSYLYRGCPADAIVNLRKAVDLAPSYFGVWANLAEGLYATEPGSEAAAAALRRTVQLSAEALEKTPADAYARAQHALNLARLGERDSAVRQAERAVAQSPGSHNVLVLAVETLEVAGLRNKALAQLEAALRSGLSLHEAEAPPGLARLRADSGYRSILQRLKLNPAADPGGLTPSPRRPCPQSRVAGMGLGSV
jgi:tetratricopeptide (TPR) repeat protein